MESNKSGSSCGCASGSQQGFQRVQRKKWRNIGRDMNLCGNFEGVCCEEDNRDTVLIQPVEGKEAKMMSLGFQVASVKKPLIAVKRIVEKGNVVQFGKREEDNYIMNVETGDKMMLKPNGKGSFVMDVKFSNGEKTEITVDSGAEENVCPYEWGQQFGMQPASRWMNFRDASGNTIEHYGKRDVLVTSIFGGETRI